MNKLNDEQLPSIAVVIPCYKVTRHIEQVIADIGPIVSAIYCVDDACPEKSGDYIENTIRDPRVTVIRHTINRGVGGAVISGYTAAIEGGASVILKIDGDGQMDPALIDIFAAPILRGEADYTKGNRFWDLTKIHRMPMVRRIGNLGLSFMAKASTGYWDIFDPTNGYTAIHSDVARLLIRSQVSERYFFETDVLFRLNSWNAVVKDIPMDAKYGDEVSGLSARKVMIEFAAKHTINFTKRIAYRYFLRDLSVASFELVLSLLLISFSIVYGGLNWWQSAHSGEPSPVGTIMVAAVSLISGLHFFLAFVSYDIARTPRQTLYPSIRRLVSAPAPLASSRDDSHLK